MLERFCGFLNLLSPMQVGVFNETQKNIAKAYNVVATESMIAAADQLKENVDDQGISDITASCNGTWQKRGHSLLNGIVTVISSSSNKCIDYRIMTKTCKACQSWGRRKDTEEYKKFIANHDCDINHEGLSGAMEATGLVECFMSSVQDQKLRYINYIGDGDSKSYSDIVAKDPYNGKCVGHIQMENYNGKLECVGHIQKRVGARLRKLKSNSKSNLSDGKPIGGKGRLTDKIINKMQNYFGIAIRQFTGTTVYELKKAVETVLFHCSEASDLNTRHNMSPRTSDSLCKFQADKVNNTNLYKYKPGLPAIIMDTIKPFFMDLSNDNLLKKCLHGETQNNSESINSVIWKRCPKDIFVGRTTLEIGVALAVINFNDGISGALKVFKNLKVKPGRNCIAYCTQNDNNRIRNMESISTAEVKQRRKQLQARRKSFADSAEGKEGTVYGA